MKNNVSASTEQITFLDKSLQITKIEFDDEGTYSCIAQNTFYDHSGPDSVQNTYQSRLDRDLRVISKTNSPPSCNILLFLFYEHQMIFLYYSTKCFADEFQE